MANYFEYKDKVAFHPGYYIKETIDESGLTQADFAKRLGTTPKNISELISGKQNLSIDIAMKLSRMTGTSIDYWLNLQKQYDSLIAEFKSDELLQNERKVFKNIDYNYFVNNFRFPKLPRKVNEQIRLVREFLNVSTLSVLTERDMTVSFRSAASYLSEANTVRANVMVQIAINKTLQAAAPKYDKKKFENAAKHALTLTKKHEDFYPIIRKDFYDAGVVFVILPNLSGSRTNGATKKVGSNIMLMVNDRRADSDSFWFTLFHEIGHIVNNDFGISFEDEKGEKEEIANRYAEDCLIPPEKYQEFIAKKLFSIQSINKFASEIDRDPGIVCGRLQKDGLVSYNDPSMESLKHLYKISTNT